MTPNEPLKEALHRKLDERRWDVGWLLPTHCEDCGSRAQSTRWTVCPYCGGALQHEWRPRFTVRAATCWDARNKAELRIYQAGMERPRGYDVRKRMLMNAQLAFALAAILSGLTLWVGRKK